MYNSRKIFIGIGIFLVIMSIPFWVNLGSEMERPEVSLDTQVIQAMEEKKCIEDTDYMRRNHMKLLVEWREDVVRDGDQTYIATDGQEYAKCMQKTCLYCHSNKDQFCDACHDYVGAELNCWDCHINMQN